MSEVHLTSRLDGPDGAPVVVLANPIGTTSAIWDAQADLLEAGLDMDAIAALVSSGATPTAPREGSP